MHAPYFTPSFSFTRGQLARLTNLFNSNQHEAWFYACSIYRVWCVENTELTSEQMRANEETEIVKAVAKGSNPSLTIEVGVYAAKLLIQEAQSLLK